MTMQNAIDESIKLLLNDLVKEAGDALATFTRANVQGDPDAKTEKAWWRSQYNAFKKAQEDVLVRGARATWVEDAYSVPSSRQGEAPHRVARLGHVYVCDCTASQNGRFCRHLALVDATVRASESRADASDILADAAESWADLVADGNAALSAFAAEHEPPGPELLFDGAGEVDSSPAPLRPTMLALGTRLARARAAVVWA